MKRYDTCISREVKRILMAGALSTGIAIPLHAQDQPIETVVVTGSHIARTDEGALPVQVITKEQIQQTGATSAEQFLKTVSAAVQGNSNVVAASTAGANVGGVSSVSLRESRTTAAQKLPTLFWNISDCALLLAAAND